jgi:hypothetical protein
MAETNAVSFKLPPFWTSQPQVWFQQAEAQFTIRKISTDETKYAYIVAALDQDTQAASLTYFVRRTITSMRPSKLDRLTKTFAAEFVPIDSSKWVSSGIGHHLP